MQKSEEIAYKYLAKKYPNQEIIFRPNDTPDFVIKGSSERYEAKSLSRYTLYFNESQLPKLKGDDYILVVGPKTVIDCFKWQDSKKTIYKLAYIKRTLHYVEKHSSKKAVKINREVYNKLKEICPDAGLAISHLLKTRFVQLKAGTIQANEFVTKEDVKEYIEKIIEQIIHKVMLLDIQPLVIAVLKEELVTTFDNLDIEKAVGKAFDDLPK